jgi:N-acetylglutamate synthase-like GNAT family acetyltransferase
MKGDHLNSYELSTDPKRLDIDMIHRYLSEEAYWCAGIPRDRVEESIRHSLNFGVYYQDQQVAFARVVSDFSTVAYLGDVFILPAHRNKGLSQVLMQSIMKHSNLQGLRRWILLTSSAHKLYAQYGFTALAQSEIYMEKYDKDVYSNPEK